MASENVVLLDASESPVCMRVRIALAEKEINYERRNEDLGNKRAHFFWK